MLNVKKTISLLKIYTFCICSFFLISLGVAEATKTKFNFESIGDVGGMAHGYIEFDDNVAPDVQLSPTQNLGGISQFNWEVTRGQFEGASIRHFNLYSELHNITWDSISNGLSSGFSFGANSMNNNLRYNNVGGFETLVFLNFFSTPSERFTHGNFVKVPSCDLSTSKLSLTSNQWYQISIPCMLPPTANSVFWVFGMYLGENTYGTDWVVYTFDSEANTYVDVGLNGTLVQGVGYWIIHTNGITIDIDLPFGSNLTSILSPNECIAINGCYRIPLIAQPEGVQWNMVGYPFLNNIALDQWRVVTKSGSCMGGCTLDQAKANNIVDNRLWHYNDGAYEVLQPGSWVGFWVKVLDGANTLESVLEIPISPVH